MRIALRLLVLIVLLAPYMDSRAQTTWSEHVAPILYNNCVTCHRQGGIAPFELITYQNALVYASSIYGQVQSGKMPPWPPDPAYSRMAHERILSASEKSAIANWYAGGKLEGNPALAPPVPVFSNNGDLPGTPDLVSRIPVYTSTANTDDEYRCFVLNTNQTADKFITAFEAIPGNRAIVHHVLVYADTTGKSTLLDNADPAPGYSSFGGIGVNEAILLGGWVPGSAPIKFPSGFGVRLPHNAKLVIQIHYPAGTAGTVDSTRIHFFFSPTNLRETYIAPALNHALNITPPLVIPPDTIKTFTEQYISPALPFTLIGIAPHMHLIGKSIEAFGVKGSDTQRFIRIPDWDFHWQGFYMLHRLMKVQPVTRLIARAVYDNTSSNHHNPNVPPQVVVAGERTTDEMMLVYFVFALYQPGDENIVIDSNVTTAVTPTTYYKGQQLLQPYPVPANNELIAKFYFDVPGNASLELINSSGQVVQRYFSNKNISSGYTTLPVSVAHLPAGIYSLRMQTATGQQTQQVVVRH